MVIKSFCDFYTIVTCLESYERKLWAVHTISLDPDLSINNLEPWHGYEQKNQYTRFLPRKSEWRDT